LRRTIELVAKFQFSEMLPTLQIESITIAELKVASEPEALLADPAGARSERRD